MSFPAWIDRVGPYNVQRMEGRRPGGQAYLKLAGRTRRVIWHTTEGSSVDGAVDTLRRNFSAPHFVIGEDRIVQMRPLWAQAATVRGDNSIAWQVEVVEFSKVGLWKPSPAAFEPMVELLRFFKDRLNVPLARPKGWRDDGSDITGIWATTSNSRRLSGRARSFEGHVMHLEWPDNTHWDQGAIWWSALIREAQDDMAAVDEIIQGNRDARDGKALPKTATKYYTWGWTEGNRHLIALRRANQARAQVRELEARVLGLEAAPPPAGGLTVADADTRYARIDHPHAAETSVT